MPGGLSAAAIFPRLFRGYCCKRRRLRLLDGARSYLSAPAQLHSPQPAALRACYRAKQRSATGQGRLSGIHRRRLPAGPGLAESTGTKFIDESRLFNRRACGERVRARSLFRGEPAIDRFSVQNIYQERQTSVLFVQQLRLIQRRLSRSQRFRRIVPPGGRGGSGVLRALVAWRPFHGLYSRRGGAPLSCTQHCGLPAAAFSLRARRPLIPLPVRCLEPGAGATRAAFFLLSSVVLSFHPEKLQYSCAAEY